MRSEASTDGAAYARALSPKKFEEPDLGFSLTRPHLPSYWTNRLELKKETIMTDKAPEITTLKQLCAELKINPREARERLRAAARDPKKHPQIAEAHKPRTPWQWVKGSAGEKEARALFRI